MKRLNDEISYEERKRKEVKLSKVILTLDETIRSKLLSHKFRILTTELQLFLQHVPVLYWYPLPIMLGTETMNIPHHHEIDSSLLLAVMKSTFHQYSALDVVKNILETVHESLQGKLLNLLKVLLDDESIILQALRECKGNGKNPLKYASDRLKDNETIVLEAIRVNGNAIKYVSQRLKENELFISETVKKETGVSIEYISDSSSETFEYIVEEEPEIIIESPYNEDSEEYKILEDVKWNNREALANATDRLKDDEDFVLRLLKHVKHSGSVLEFVSDRLKDNEKIVLESIKVDGYALQYASDRLRNDKAFIFQAINMSGTALRYASPIFQDDEIIVMDAVKKSGLALDYASARLKYNEEIVFEAVKNCSYALRYVPQKLRDDEQFILKLVKTCGLNVYDKVKDNELMVLEAVKIHGSTLKYASDRLKDNELIVLEAVNQNGLALEYVSARFKDNEHIVLEAIKNNGNALKYASNRLRNDSNFANEIFKYCKSLDVFEWFGPELRSIEFICHYIEKNLSAFHEFLRKSNSNRKSLSIDATVSLFETLGRYHSSKY